MNEKDYNSRSENHLKKPCGRRNHVTEKNIKKQYQGARSFEKTRKR